MSDLRRHCRTVLLLSLLLLLPACHHHGDTSAAPPLVRVAGRTITLAQFRAAFAKLLPGDRQLSIAQKKELEKALLVQIIDRELMLAAADRLGIRVAPEEVDRVLAGYRKDYPDRTFAAVLRQRQLTPAAWRREIARNLRLEKVVRRAAYGSLAVSETEIAAYYHGHAGDFDRPAQVRARQIVVASRAEGKRLLARLHRGASFARLARTYSLSPDREQGGDLGFFARGEMPPAFDAVVFKLPVHQLSDLVKSRYGYHIFLVEARRPAAQLSLARVRERIRGTLLAAKREEAYRKWLQGLRARATIRVDWSQLKSSNL